MCVSFSIAPSGDTHATVVPSALITASSLDTAPPPGPPVELVQLTGPPPDPTLTSFVVCASRLRTATWPGGVAGALVGSTRFDVLSTENTTVRPSAVIAPPGAVGTPGAAGFNCAPAIRAPVPLPLAIYESALVPPSTADANV